MSRLWEFYLTLATHDDLKNGITIAEWRKVIVADPNIWEAYKIAIEMVWRTETQVTNCQIVLNDSILYYDLGFGDEDENWGPYKK